MTTVAVIAKECVPGRVKTRLHPPFTLDEAAQLAAASLDDTLVAVAGLPVSRHVLYFEGGRPPASAAGFEVMPQGSGTLDERLAQLFDVLSEPVLLVGMDTPQLTGSHLAAVLDSFDGDAGADAADGWIGPAADGGFWLLALRAPRGDLVRGVPMSRSDTGARQRLRLVAAGLTVGVLPELTDVDSIAEAALVAREAPGTRFAREFRRFTGARG
ncbi:TIGR04282 family arsenosugar biosynthesis glycosyltransferase [Agromyces italicus]|uniref:TIGR04282 family arsenosugar biosynthesis glycosyltransferase n=1 Tax=Agromyces italicus TaxID=279572 RepID=UPI0003B41D40|nr:DUF2064 domain-containing protein [Agromyces italicus]